jgi:outer membrane protein assembly factor BamA
VVRALFGLVLVLIASGCPGSRSRPRFPGEIWLAEIEVEGNQAIEDDDLVPGLAIERLRREGRAVDPYLLSLDTKRIRGAFRRLGFFDVEVTARIDRKDKAETVVFRVVEGPRARARVAITGLPPELPEAEVLDKLELKENAPFDYELFDDGRDIVKALVEEVGYPYVVDDSVVTVDRVQGVAFASYRIDPGPRATIGAITIEGVDPSDALHGAIRGRLAFAEGDLYSPRALLETTRALNELGRFSQIRIVPDREQVTPVIPVTIRVAIAGRTEIRVGGGFGLDPQTYEARVRGGFSWVPPDYPLWTLSGDSRIAARYNKDTEDVDPRVRALLSAQRLDLFRPRVVGKIEGGFDFFTVEAYTAQGPLLRLETSSPLGVRWLTARVGWAFSYLEFSDVSEVLDLRARRELGLVDWERYGRFEQTIIADLRDDSFEPRKGYFIALRVAEGTAAAGGAFDNLVIEPDFRAYYPVGRVVFAAHARGGRIFGEVPATIRYFSGGAQNHRGFAARRLAPQVDAFDDTGQLVGSVRIGGEAFLETGVEARIELGKLWGLPIGTTLFLDGGDVPFDPDDLDLLDLHWAGGVGLFVKLGALKVRFDVGKRLTRLPVGLDGVPDTDLFHNIEYFLGVGETF